MSFELDTVVITPAGRGRVVYAEADYIEVEIAGNEMGFESPFNGIKTVREIETAEQLARDAAFDNLDIDAKIAAKLNWMCAASLVEILGGTCVEWDELTSDQKMNYAKVKL